MIDRRDFDALVFAYLDGDATAQQVIALRDALQREPELRPRLAALVRLHRAQAAVLGRARTSALAEALAGLRRFADRAGRFLAHACVLALVFVELDVAMPGLDTHAWLQPEVVAEPEVAPTDGAEVAVDAESSPAEESPAMSDVREPDFLDS